MLKIVLTINGMNSTIPSLAKVRIFYFVFYFMGNCSLLRYLLQFFNYVNFAINANNLTWNKLFVKNFIKNINESILAHSKTDV